MMFAMAAPFLRAFLMEVLAGRFVIQVTIWPVACNDAPDRGGDAAAMISTRSLPKR